MPVSMLERIKNDKVDGTEWDNKDNVLHVYNPHALTQVSGYIKYMAGNYKCAAYYRGQEKRYYSCNRNINIETMLPSLYRNNTPLNHSGISNYNRILNNYINNTFVKDAFFKGTDQNLFEPILQHYGMNTRWLDLVDNIWVALWFACHSSRIKGIFNQYANFEKRSVFREPDGYAYIVLMRLSEPIEQQPGFFEANDGYLVDLRVAAPSMYLRPHAQHGLLIKKKDKNNSGPNMMNMVAGIIRIHLYDALDWLGSGTLLSTHTLFPPLTYDLGYKKLLEELPGYEKRYFKKDFPMIGTLTNKNTDIELLKRCCPLEKVLNNEAINKELFLKKYCPMANDFTNEDYQILGSIQLIGA